MTAIVSTIYGAIPIWGVESSTSSETLPPFPYQPLEKHQIRLMQVESISKGLIHCTIINVSLEENPKYYALSYCWGSDIRNENFPIGDELFKVTPNLLAALGALNAVMEECDIRKYCIWVDAICIDQENTAEKSVQIPLMDKIYSKADKVLIWLGEEADQSNKIMMILSWLSSNSHYQRLLENGPDSSSEVDLASYKSGIDKYVAELAFLTEELERDYTVEAKNLQALQSFIEELKKRQSQPSMQREPMQNILQSDRFRDCLFKKSDPFWQEFVIFVNRPWFSRVWTYQELMLSRGATVMCGKITLEWRSVLEPRHYLFHVACFEEVYSMRQLGPRYIDLYRQMQGRTLSVRPLAGATTFHQLLLRIRSRQAREPRDYIYGILGLVDEEILDMIPVDYDLSEASVFSNAVKVACGLPDGALFFCELLEECTITQKIRVKDLPTWCPDFSNGEWDVEAKSTTDPLISESAVKAFGKYASVRYGPDNSIMHVAGMRVDQVEVSANIRPPSLNEFDSLDASTSEEVFIATCFRGATYEWLKLMQELFISQNRDLSQSWLEKYFFAKSQEPVHNLHSRFNEILRCCEQIQSQDIKSLLEAIDKLEITPTGLQRMVQDIVLGSTSHGSKIFFRTASGRLGFSVAPTQPGNNVCLTPGGTYLQILSWDCTEYITCASVEGLMGDALLSRYEAWKNQCETFHLE